MFKATNSPVRAFACFAREYNGVFKGKDVRVSIHAPSTPPSECSKISNFKRVDCIIVDGRFIL